MTWPAGRAGISGGVSPPAVRCNRVSGSWWSGWIELCYRFVVFLLNHYIRIDFCLPNPHYCPAPASQNPRTRLRVDSGTYGTTCVSTAHKAVRRGCDWNEVVL